MLLFGVAEPLTWTVCLLRILEPESPARNLDFAGGVVISFVLEIDSFSSGFGLTEVCLENKPERPSTLFALVTLHRLRRWPEGNVCEEEVVDDVFSGYRGLLVFWSECRSADFDLRSSSLFRPLFTWPDLAEVLVVVISFNSAHPVFGSLPLPALPGLTTRL